MNRIDRGQCNTYTNTLQFKISFNDQFELNWRLINQPIQGIHSNQFNCPLFEIVTVSDRNDTSDVLQLKNIYTQ